MAGLRTILAAACLSSLTAWPVLAAGNPCEAEIIRASQRHGVPEGIPLCRWADRGPVKGAACTRMHSTSPGARCSHPPRGDAVREFQPRPRGRA